MDSLSTPLLHYVRTGKMFDAQVVASDDEKLLPDDLRKAYFSLRTTEAMESAPIQI